MLAEVGIFAVNMLTGLEEASIADKLRDEAPFSLEDAYRRFAREHTELYRMTLIRMPVTYFPLNVLLFG